MARKKSNPPKATKSDVVRELLAGNPKMPAKEVIAKLQERGVKASLALVNKLKSSTRGKKRGGRQRGGNASKADAIRGMFAELGHDARPRDVIAQLKGRGVRVTSAQVSMLRGKLPANGTPRTPAPATVSWAHLVAAKELSARVGGIQNARRALDSLAQLIEA